MTSGGGVASGSTSRKQRHEQRAAAVGRERLRQHESEQQRSGASGCGSTRASSSGQARMASSRASRGEQ
ncbi:hypothetical protein ABZ215_31920 [Amycolatopsis sp. NPDC006131]|uniref:hypothetical protein n=1 Tax=Amycolatopsis sp. NPDC006131 TaxID=3156731 RepID=UPI0033A39ACB